MLTLRAGLMFARESFRKCSFFKFVGTSLRSLELEILSSTISKHFEQQKSISAVTLEMFDSIFPVLIGTFTFSNGESRSMFLSQDNRLESCLGSSSSEAFPRR